VQSEDELGLIHTHIYVSTHIYGHIYICMDERELNDIAQHHHMDDHNKGRDGLTRDENREVPHRGLAQIMHTHTYIYVYICIYINKYI